MRERTKLLEKRLTICNACPSYDRFQVKSNYIVVNELVISLKLLNMGIILNH
jgi:hypothetical protein